MDNSILWLWLNQNVGLSRSRQIKLLEHFGDIRSIYEANLSDYGELKFLTPEDMNLLCDKELTLCYEESEKLSKLGGGIITIDSPQYPQLLKDIATPPTVLYYRGKLVDLNSSLCIAMVGTRKATDYGKQCALALSKGLSQNRVIVVSGLAMGIDARSHEGALKGGSPTIAVIGCGVDIAYPKSNAAIMKDIISNGMVLSEYPLGTRPEKYHFPERNRIISGICHGTLVVEADFKSGSLITAKYSLDQNRDVFAVPGNINSVYSKGTNYLLKDGAHFVTTTEDITEFYRYDYPQFFVNPPVIYNEPVKEYTPPKGSPEELILKAIGENNVHTDTICEKTGLDIGTVNATLLMMEITGKLSKLPGGYYTRTKRI